MYVGLYQIPSLDLCCYYQESIEEQATDMRGFRTGRSIFLRDVLH